LVVFDPVYLLLPTDEISADEMSAMLSYLNSLRSKFGCAILVVHHTRKGAGWRGVDRNPMDRPRGHSSFTGWPSANIVLSWPRGGENERSHIQADFTLRNQPDLPTQFWKRPTADCLWFSPDPEYADRVERPVQEPKGLSKVVEALQFCGHLAPMALAKEVARRAKVSDRTARERITEAVERGLIVKENGVYRSCS
jgi:hypothetical protein